MLTQRWLDRCIKRFNETEPLYGYQQSLFPIVQGCTYPDLRREAAKFVADKGADGNAIGGLAVGEPTEVMYDMIEVVNEILPKDKPRYLMGVGTPQNILEAIERGVDMFDCVMPTRNGRNAMLFTYNGTMNMRNKKWEMDFSQWILTAATSTSSPPSIPAPPLQGAGAPGNADSQHPQPLVLSQTGYRCPPPHRAGRLRTVEELHHRPTRKKNIIPQKREEHKPKGERKTMKDYQYIKKHRRRLKLGRALSHRFGWLIAALAWLGKAMSWLGRKLSFLRVLKYANPFHYIKRLDWYIMKKFLGYYFFSIALIISIAIVFDFNDNLAKFSENHAPARAIIFDYYANFVPYFANLFSALFVFVAVILFTSKLAGNSEIIASWHRVSPSSDCCAHT